MGNSRCKWLGCRRKRSDALKMSSSSLRSETAAGNSIKQLNALWCNKYAVWLYYISEKMFFLINLVVIFSPLDPQNFRTDFCQRSLIPKPRCLPDYSAQEREDARQVFIDWPGRERAWRWYIQCWPPDTAGGSRDQQEPTCTEGRQVTGEKRSYSYIRIQNVFS